MKRTKALRRRCDLPACGKLYRHSDPRSRTCSATCRLRLYRAHKKAAAQVEQEQVEAELHGKYARMQARAQADMMDSRPRQPAPAPRTRAATPPPAPAPWPYTHISRPEPPPQTVIIRYRKPYMTPL